MAIRGRIQILRGMKADFNPAKLLPGEWAVSIDADTNNQIVWMCFAPGIVKRMGTYEDFKKQIADATGDIRDQYMTEFQSVLDQIDELAGRASTNADAVLTIRNEIVDDYLPRMQNYSNSTAQYALNAADSATLAESAGNVAESYAVGGTGTREGEDTDNAKYYAEQAKNASNKEYLDDIALAESLGWNKCTVRGTKWSDLGEAYAAFIPSSNCVNGGTYLVKLNNGSVHKVTVQILSTGEIPVGLKNGKVLLGNDVPTATKNGISLDPTTGKKAWVTGSSSTKYTISKYSDYGAPVVISSSNTVKAWYCKIDDSSQNVKELMTRYPTVTEAGQYAVDAVELNSSVDGTLANKIAAIENDIDTLTKNTRSTAVSLNAYNTADNLYTFPNDGYVYISSENVTSGFIRVALYSSQGVNYPMGYMYQTITAAWQTQTTYVRKGMKMFCPIATEGTKVIFYSF